MDRKSLPAKSIGQCYDLASEDSQCSDYIYYCVDFHGVMRFKDSCACVMKGKTCQPQDYTSQLCTILIRKEIESGLVRKIIYLLVKYCYSKNL